MLVDLGRLNRIVDFNEELAYVTIEPGVTQRQLYEFLRERGSRLWMDATGASPDCSIIGNTMERGFGHTPMGDHCSNVCGFEVVLPDGECIETGFARFPGAHDRRLEPLGRGPSLDGLFSQSNFGIVTRMSVWLMPAPEHFEAFFFMCSAEAGIGPIIDALRPLRMNGTLRSVMHIGNDYKVLAGTTPVSVGRYAMVDTPLDAASDGAMRTTNSAWAAGTAPAVSTAPGAGPRSQAAAAPRAGRQSRPAAVRRRPAASADATIRRRRSADHRLGRPPRR